MKRFLAPLTVALLFALVAITVVGGVAFGVIVDPPGRVQAENMIENSDRISVQPDPDGTATPPGPHLKWANGAGVTDRASQSITVPTGSTVNQIQVFTRQQSGGPAVFAIYVQSGTAPANRVGTFTPPTGLSAWSTLTVNLTTAIQPGTHTLFIGPNATFSNNAFIDYFELHNTGSTPAAQCADGIDNDDDRLIDLNDPGCSSSTDNDETNSTTPPTGVFNPGIGKGSASECTTTIGPGSPDIIETAANNLNAGGVLCLRGGIYQGGDSRINIRTSGTASAPKKIKAYPGERVEIRAGIRANVPGNNWVIEGVFVDASYSPVSTDQTGQGPRTNTDQAISWGEGNNVVVDSVELINRRPGGNPDLAGTCLFGGRSVNLTIQNSWIHQCGQLPRDNLEHCVYAAFAQDMKILNNLITDCANRSVLLYPDTDNALVEGNLISSIHQTGIRLAESADNNRVLNNVVYTPNGDTIETANNLTGAGNVVRDNCVWDVLPKLAANVVSSGNELLNPQIVPNNPPDRSAKVTNTRCADKLPAGTPFR